MVSSYVSFPDKHCVCVHKRKIRHTSFEIYRILVKLSFGEQSKRQIFLLYQNAQKYLGANMRSVEKLRVHNCVTKNDTLCAIIFVHKGDSPHLSGLAL